MTEIAFSTKPYFKYFLPYEIDLDFGTRELRSYTHTHMYVIYKNDRIIKESLSVTGFHNKARLTFSSRVHEKYAPGEISIDLG